MALKNMAGTVLITGANGSLAIPSVKYLLTHFPDHTAVLTVRNTSDSDVNTARLKATIAQFPNAKASIRKLDLGSLAEVQTFAQTISTDITNKTLPPIASIICNACVWSINDGLKFTSDGNELSLGVNHLAQLSLVLRLLGSFNADGRVVFLISDAHFPGKNGLEKYPASIPEDIETLLKPKPDIAGQEVGRGFQRYGNSKLAVLMAMYELNKRLLQDPNLKSITAIGLDPGGLPDSRIMFKGDVPGMWKNLMKVLNTVQPVAKFMIPTLRSVNSAAKDLVEIAVGKEYNGARGFYQMSKPGQSSPESKDEAKQLKVWLKSLEWAHITQDDTPLTTAFPKSS